jgi:hypothetical protein
MPIASGPRLRLGGVLPFAVLLLASFGWGSPITAQEPAVEADSAAAEPGLLKVFVDCQVWRCGDRLQRFRERIEFVEWVQLPQDADILVLWTGQGAGAGYQYVFDFIAQSEELQGVEDRLTFTSSVTDVDEEVLQALTRTLAAGLVRYLALRGDAVSLDVVPVEGALEQVRGRRGPGGDGNGGDQEDPWDYWIFNLNARADIEREDQVEDTQIRFGASANRTTETWKIDFGFRGNIELREFQVDSTTRARNELDDYGGDLLIVRSINDHWSWGGQLEIQTSTRLNQDLRYVVSPAVEWNYFPWQDATRRRFVVLYTNGVQYVDYEERTVFEKDRETLWVHALDVSYRAQEPWGQARAGVEANHIINLDSKYSIELNGQLDYRLFRGLNLGFEIGYEIIRDQIFLSGRGADPDEIFLRQRQLATGSRFEFGVNVSYRFGSIYNSIVNARFPSFGGWR